MGIEQKSSMLSTVFGLVLFAGLLGGVQADDDWLPMPNGMFHHISCIYQWEDHFSLATHPSGIQTVTTATAEHKIEPCAFKPRSQEQMTAQSAHTLPPDLVNVSAPSPPLSYYSDWSVYAQTVAEGSNFSSMSSSWVVPPAPHSRGPLGLSSIYLFNGLEDGGGVHGAASLILQPVLQLGKSGCVLNPLAWNSWHLAAYYVSGDGRAHCGKIIKVQPADVVTGSMTLASVADNGQSNWLVTASVAGGTTSSLNAAIGVGLNAAYLTLEAMILYSCSAYPQSNNVTFTANQLKQSSGADSAAIEWTPKVRHSECGQAVQVHNDDVMLTWQSTN